MTRSPDDRPIIRSPDDGDFTPYGGERAYTNTCAQNYKFEGKERDTETQNDDFGAREYSWRFGRWLSSDWSSVPVAVPYANLTNPQTLNLYSMVADDPESFADLDGHDAAITTANGQSCARDASGANCTSAPAAIAATAATTSSAPTTMEEIDAVVKPLIESAAETSGTILTSVLKGACEVLCFVLATEQKTADNAHDTIQPEKEHAPPEPAASSDGARRGGNVRDNKARGDAYRDQVADALTAAGRSVKKEVPKKTPFGPRVIDIEVQHNGKTLGGIETKTGSSRYRSRQRAKDNYLKQQGYPVNVIRQPNE